MTPPRADLAQTERLPKLGARARSGRTPILIVAEERHLAGDLPSLACAAEEAGYEAHIVAPFAGQATRDEEACPHTLTTVGLDHYVLPQGRSPSGSGLSSLRALAKLIRTLEPALLHCIGIKPVIYAGALARAMRLAAVHAPRGLRAMIGDEVHGASLRRFLVLKAVSFALGNPRASVTVTSPEERAFLSRLRLVCARRAFLSRGVGVDVKRFCPRAPGEPRQDRAPVVMFAASLASPGGRDCLAAARRMHAKGARALFVFLCDCQSNGSRSVAEVKFASGEPEGVIEWWRDSRDVSAVLRQADLFCMPGCEGEEAPKALIEAAAAGLPLVSADAPGCRQVVRQGVNGLLVPPGNAETLCDALTRFVGDPELRHAAGSRSREIAEAEFSLEAVVTAALIVYHATMDWALVGATR